MTACLVTRLAQNLPIIGCDEQSVTFRYTPTGATRTVTQFVGGFVQHLRRAGFRSYAITAG